MEHPFRWALPTLLGLASIDPVTAQAATINPASFASGQYVSYATPGVTLSTFGLTAVGSNLGLTTFGPTTAPVYAVGKYFSSTPSSASYWSVYNSPTFTPSVTNCLHGCSGAASMNTIKLLKISFSSPVREVSVLQYANAFNYAFMQVFNKAGHLIGFCTGLNDDGPQSTGRIDCFGVLNDTNLFDNTWRFTISDPNADISTVLVGAGDQADQIGTIEYH